MSTLIHGMLSGSFTSNGLARFISLPCGYDFFELHNISDLAVPAAANTNVMHARGTSLMPAGTGYVSLKTNGAATVALEIPLATTGFTFVADIYVKIKGITYQSFNLNRFEEPPQPLYFCKFVN